MTGNDAYALQHSDLNGFLFAQVGEESGGNPLSVLSVLARLGLDPWQEARRLANLPVRAAVEGLAQTIAGMPASPWPLPDATMIAERLVGLLPRHQARAAPGRLPQQRGNTQAARRLALALLVAAAVLGTLALRFAG